MKAELKVGMRHGETLRVDASLTVPRVSPAFASFAEIPPVFATAYLVGFVEWVAVEALRPYLEAGESTVGTHIDISHVAATPVGMTVAGEVELIAREGRKLRFRVSCRDEAGLIGEGFHERAVIDVDRFMGRLKEKSEKSRPPA